MDGNPLNVHKLMANHPGLLRAWWNYRNYSVTGGDLSPRQRELVILRTAFHTGTDYEWLSHQGHAKKAGLSEEEIESIRRSPENGNLGHEDTLLLEAVDQCVKQSVIEADLLAQLDNILTTQQLMDVMAISGMYSIIGTMVNTWGLQLDERFCAEATDSN